MTWKYSDHVRCGCRGRTGKLLGQTCPQLWRKDGSWNSRHGSAGFAGRVPTSDGHEAAQEVRLREQDQAEEAAQHVGQAA